MKLYILTRRWESDDYDAPEQMDYFSREECAKDAQRWQYNNDRLVIYKDNYDKTPWKYEIEEVEVNTDEVYTPPRTFGL